MANSFGEFLRPHRTIPKTPWSAPSRWAISPLRVLVLVLGLFVFGVTKKGQTNWYQFGGFGFQPSEFVKTGTALLLAKYLKILFIIIN